MKAIIPLAGIGTRLRPLTHHTPKPLVRVAGRPVMSYILDDLLDLGVQEIVFVIGYLGDHVRAYVAEAYPELHAHYVVQEVQNGTAGAVQLGEPYVDGDVLILFVDTLFEADLSLIRRLEPEWSGVLWAKEVEDYHRYGVIVTGDDGAMTRIVEKPTAPVSKLANIGLYYVRDHRLLFEGIRNVLTGPAARTGEFYLTDAFQYMVDRGARLRTAPVEGWFDCGKPDTLLETNLHLLRGGRSGIDPEARVVDSVTDADVRIEAGAAVRGSRIGAGVTLEAGATVEGSDIENTIVGAGTTVTGSRIRDSLIGAGARIAHVSGSFLLADHSVVTGQLDA